MVFQKRLLPAIWLFLIFLFHGTSTLSQTRLVSNSGTDVGDCLGAPCASINYTISQSNAGDTIQIAQGLYEENVLINVPNLHLEGFQVGISARNPARDGSQESVIRPPITALGSNVIQIQNDGITLDGLALDGRTSVASRGVFFQNQNNLQVQNCRIVNLISYSLLSTTAAGILGDGLGSNNLIQENFFENIRQDDIDYALNVFDLLGGVFNIPDIESFLPARGIWLQNNCYADILNNQLDSITIGIEINNYNAVGVDSRIENNFIDSFLQGISIRNLFTNSSLWSIQNNQLVFTQAGLLSEINISLPPFFSATYDFRVPNSAINLDLIQRNCVLANNDINGSYYGYFAYGTSNGSNTLINGGSVQRVALGLACLNENDTGTPAETVISIQNTNMFDFNGAPDNNVPDTIQILGFDILLNDLTTNAFNFQAGIYGFASNNGQNITIEVNNCQIQGTNAQESPSAGIYCDAQNGSSGNISVSVRNSRIFNHLNRGIHMNQFANARFVTCQIDHNGSAGFQNDGLGVILRNNAQAYFQECTLDNQLGTLYANLRLQDNSTATLLNCSLLSALHQIDNDGGGIVQAFGCWWGSNDPVTVASGFVNTNAGNVDFSPWLDSGTDTDALKEGFQGDWSFFHVGNAGNDLSPDGRIQEAMDSLIDGGDILIHSASYTESPVVRKNIRLSNDGIVQIDSLELDVPGGTLDLINDLSINNHLLLRNGHVQNNTAELAIFNTNPNAALSLNPSAYVQGSLRWNVQSSQDYLFPVGENGAREGMQVRLNNQTGIVSLVGRFWPNDPLNNPIASSIPPFSENTFFYGILVSQGYWELNPNPGGNASNYDISLLPSFLSGQEAAIVKRSLPNTLWLADGNAFNVLGGYGRSGLNGFSNFTLALENVPTPLQLGNFEVNLREEGAQVNWEVFNNVDIEQIRIQRADEDLSFKTIARQDLAVTYQPKTYTYLDREVLGFNTPLWYYRLAYTEQSGKQVYSQVLALRTDAVEKLVIYPNPSQESIQIRALGLESPLRWELWNSQGQKVLSLSGNKVKPTISIKHLPSGHYFLRSVYPNRVFVRKFLKY